MNGGDRPRSRSGRSQDCIDPAAIGELQLQRWSALQSAVGAMSVSVRRSVAFDISNVGASISTLDRGFDRATFNALAHAR